MCGGLCENDDKKNFQESKINSVNVVGIVFPNRWICPCVRDPKTNSRIPQLARRYNNAIKDLLDSGRYDGKDDFTIVYQPFLQNTRSPLMVGKT